MREPYYDIATDMRWSANRTEAGDQRKIQRSDPARRQVVDRRDRVERAHPGRQAAGRGRIAARAVSEPERGLLEDAGRALDIHPVDVVVVTGWPVGGGVEPDAIDVFQLNPGLTLVD